MVQRPNEELTHINPKGLADICNTLLDYNFVCSETDMDPSLSAIYDPKYDFDTDAGLWVPEDRDSGKQSQEPAQEDRPSGGEDRDGTTQSGGRGGSNPFDLRSSTSTPFQTKSSRFPSGKGSKSVDHLSVAAGVAATAGGYAGAATGTLGRVLGGVHRLLPQWGEGALP